MCPHQREFVYFLQLFLLWSQSCPVTMTTHILMTFLSQIVERSSFQFQRYFVVFFFFFQDHRGFIKGWQPGKLTGCQIDHAWLLLLLNQVVFLQESVNINNLCPPVKTEYPPVQNLNETPETSY